MYNPGSNPFTSHAKRTGSFPESNRVIGPAPERPATSALQLSATVFPTGVTSPRPVTATRRFTLYFPIFSCRYCSACPTVRSFSASSSGMSMSNSFSKAITSSTVSRLSAPRSSMKLASEVSLSRSTPSSSTMMSLTFSSSCFMSIAMGPLNGGVGKRSQHHPAVDDQHLTRNVAREVGHEKEHRRGDIRPLPEPAQRDRPAQGLPCVAGDGAGELRIGEARSHRVHDHVDPPEVPLDGGNGRLHLRGVADITAIAARRAVGQRMRGGLGFGAVAPQDRHPRARYGEGLRDGVPDAPASSRDDRDLARQVDLHLHQFS